MLWLVLIVAAVISTILVARWLHDSDLDWLTSGAYAVGCLMLGVVLILGGCWAIFAFTDFGN